ncbi:amidohydrolase family protein [Spirosoma koreense]
MLCSGLASAQQASEKLVLIKAGKFYDSEKAVFLKNQQILIKDGKVVEVGTAVKAPAGAQVLDLSGCTVTPGLMDMHTHVLFSQKADAPLHRDLWENSEVDRALRSVGFVRSYLEAGFTTIRDVGNSGKFLDYQLDRAIRDKHVVGPEMYVSGPILSPPGGQFSRLGTQNQHLIDQDYRVVRNADDARLAVEEHIGFGVDFIKVVVNNDRIMMDSETLKTIVATAHRNHYKVTAHATYEEPIREAIAAGVDGIEHGYYLSDSLLTLMSQKGIYLVPTDPSFDAYKRSASIGGFTIKDEEIRRQLAGLQERLRKAIQKGVRIVAGSDAYVDLKQPRGESAKDMLVAYVESGIKPAEALTFTTRNAASIVGQEQRLGVLKKDSYANLVAFAGDLETDFKTALYAVRLVMKEGTVYFDKPEVTMGRKAQ